MQKTNETKLTKYALVEAVYRKVGGVSKAEAQTLVQEMFEVLKETLGRGETIKISGFGQFVLRDKHARKGRNPQTGGPLTIAARRVLMFKPSPLLKNMMNCRPLGAEETAAGEEASADGRASDVDCR